MEPAGGLVTESGNETRRREELVAGNRQVRGARKVPNDAGEVQVLVSPHLADTTLTPPPGGKENRDPGEGFVYPEIAEGEKESQKCVNVKTVAEGERERSSKVKK